MNHGWDVLLDILLDHWLIDDFFKFLVDNNFFYLLINLLIDNFLINNDLVNYFRVNNNWLDNFLSKNVVVKNDRLVWEMNTWNFESRSWNVLILDIVANSPTLGVIDILNIIQSISTDIFTFAESHNRFPGKS